MKQIFTAENSTWLEDTHHETSQRSSGTSQVHMSILMNNTHWTGIAHRADNFKTDNNIVNSSAENHINRSEALNCRQTVDRPNHH